MMMVQLNLQINAMEREMNKPILIAICGKSAAGKDSLAKELTRVLLYHNVRCKRLISDTTRPRRINEVQDIDYHFITEYEFKHNIALERYIEFSYFHRWYYGINKFQIHPDVINVGVFNPIGIRQLDELQNLYNIIVVYIDMDFKERMRRSIARENKFRIEFLRRAFADHQDFNNIESYIQDSFRHNIIFKNRKNIVLMAYSVYFDIRNKLDITSVSMGKKV